MFAQAREAARKTSCLSNFKQVGLGLLMYSQDYDEMYTPWHICATNNGTGGTIAGDPWGAPAPCRDSQNFDLSWDRLIQPYVKNGQITGCPSDNTPGTGQFRFGVGGTATRSMSYPGNIGGNWCPNSPANKQPNVPEPVRTIFMTERDNCAAAIDAWGADPRPAWNWCAVNDAESETAWRHNRMANFLYADGHAKATPYVPGTSAGVSSGGKTLTANPMAGIYKFPGYDWSRTDGSLWAAWNPVPGGIVLDNRSDCGRVPVDIPGSQIP